jgi:monofunctional chorismate mutase
MDQLQTLRNQIDEIDREMQTLFLKRMDIVAAIAEYKMSLDLSVYDHNREEEVIRKNVERIPDSPYAIYYQRFLENVLKESKAFQKDLVVGRTL